MADQEKIQIAIEAINNAKSALEDASKDVERYKENSQSSLESLKSSYVEFAAKVATAIYSINKAWDYANLYAKFEEQKEALNNIAAVYGTTADAVIQSAQDSAKGLISQAEAVNLLAQAMNSGLDPKYINAYIKELENLSDVTGQDIPQAFDALQTAIVGGFERSLRMQGIIDDFASAESNYAKKLGISKEQLTQKQKVELREQVVLEALKARTASLGESTQSTADKMEVFTKKVDDLKLALGKLSAMAILTSFSLTEQLGIGLAQTEKIFWSFISAITYGDTAIGSFARQRIADLTASITSMRKEVQSNKDLFDSLLKGDSGTSKTGAVINYGDGGASAAATAKTKENLDKLKDIIRDAREEWARNQVSADEAEIMEIRQKYDREIAEVEKSEGTKADKIEAIRLLTANKNHAIQLKEIEQVEKHYKEQVELAETALKQEQEAYDAQAQYWADYLSNRKSLDRELTREGQSELEQRLADIDNWAEDTIERVYSVYETESEIQEAITKIHQIQATKKLQINNDYLTQLQAKEEELATELQRIYGSYYEGFGAGMSEWYKSLKTEFDNGVELAKSTAESMSTAFGDFFFNIFEGKLNSLGDVLRNFLSSIARTVSSQLGNTITSSLFGLFSGSVTSAATSGVSSLSLPTELPYIGKYATQSAGLSSVSSSDMVSQLAKAISVNVGVTNVNNIGDTVIENMLAKPKTQHLIRNIVK